MKLVILSLILAFSVYATPVQTHGALKVTDGQIVNKNGQPPQLRGMSLFWNKWTEGSVFYNATAINHLADTWKVSVVRAAIGNGSIEDAKTVIDAAIAKGIYVIVDWHVHDIQTEQAKSFFQQVSAYVKNTYNNAPNVIYEIFNEPIKESWSEIKQYAEQVIPVIRANSPDNLIIVGTPFYSAVVTAPIGGTQSKGMPYTLKDDRLSGSNIAYAVHFYASQDTHEKYMSWITMAQCNKVPVFATEWGISDASGDGAYRWDLIKKWVSYAENAKLSWAAWSVANKNESSAVMLPGTSANDVGNANSWSEGGKYLQGLISKLNQGQTHSDVTKETIVCPEVNTGAPEREDGGGRINQVIEAESYLQANGASEQSVSGATGGQVLANMSANAKATYWLEADFPMVQTMYVKLRSTATQGVLNWQIGDFNGSWDLPDSMATNKWVYFTLPVAIPQGRNNFTLSFTGFNNNLEIDNFSFAAPTQTDSLNFGYLAMDSTGNAYPVKLSASTRSSLPLAFKQSAGGLSIIGLPHLAQIEVRSLQGKRLYATSATSSQILIPQTYLAQRTVLVTVKHQSQTYATVITAVQ